MTCKFSLPVPKHSWILNQPISTANIYYICGECDDSNVFEHVEMRMISEVQPENRLKTLIKKGLLDEAEVRFSLQKMRFLNNLLTQNRITSRYLR